MLSSAIGYANQDFSKVCASMMQSEEKNIVDWIITKQTKSLHDKSSGMKYENTGPPAVGAKGTLTEHLFIEQTVLILRCENICIKIS